MNKRGIIISISAIIIVFAGIIFYGYNEATPEIRQDIIEMDNENIKGPAIEVSPENYDLGTVIFGDVPERIFTVKNSGNKPLEILRLSTSCGCTQATIAEEDKIIAPNKSVSMLVTFDPAVHKDATDLGELTRIIYIKTNDPKNPEIEVTITANVIKTD